MPSSPEAHDWRAQIRQALEVISNMEGLNSGSQDCYEVITQLVGPFLNSERTTDSPSIPMPDPTEESPQTQISNVYSMLWPNVNSNEIDLLMQDGAWGNFIGDDLSMDAFTTNSDT
jgi:transcriptional regulatory protein GAL4